MNTEGNIYALNKHLSEIEAQDAFDEAVESKSNEIYDLIMNQNLFKCPKNSQKIEDLYHFNDFVADCIDDIDNLVYDVMKGNHKSVVVQCENKLQKWCNELAIKAIKGS